VVIDPFCGTGSVGVAAAMLGGYALLSDIDKRTSRNVRFHVKRQLALNDFAPTTGLLRAGEREEEVNLPEPGEREEEDKAADEEDEAFDDDDSVSVQKVKLRELHPTASSSSSSSSTLEKKLE
jgi:hypothetical protein